ncbi:MAG: ROK family protein [Chloroflexota bacterium]
MAEPLYLGIDIGGTKVLAVAGTSDGQRLGVGTIPTPSQGSADEVAEALASAARAAAQTAGATLAQVAGVGIASAGAVDMSSGVVVHSPHVASMRRTPLVAMLARRLGGARVVMGNDATLAALGEQRFGAGRGVDELLFITISTGIGGGIVTRGQLLLGAGGYAGEIGHMSIDAHGPYGKSTMPGAWESLCSGSALARIAGERLAAGEASTLAQVQREQGVVDARAVFAALHAGDGLARRIVDDATHYLGIGLAGLVNLLNPQRIIIGGGLSNEWDDYIAPAIALMRRHTFGDVGAETEVVPPALGAGAGAWGAIALAAQG